MTYENFVRIAENIRRNLENTVKTTLDFRETNFIYAANIRFSINSWEVFIVFQFHREKFYIDVSGTLFGICTREENLKQLRHIIEKTKESFVLAMKDESEYRMQTILSLDALLLDYTEKTLKETIERNRS